ncbi:MAG: SH3-like domain-containing protein [Alkalibacterium sp.]|nr:SH3-like domain-containing protein [Alkalibacterium sp.]
MNKKKLFSVVSTGILAFSSGAPSVLAGAPFVLDLLQNDNELEFTAEDGRVLTDIVEVTDKDIRDLLSGIYISQNEEGTVNLVGNSRTYKLIVSLNDETVTVDEQEDFNLVITLNEDTQNEELSIKIISADESVVEILLPLDELTNKADVSDTYETDPSETDSEEMAEDSEIEETEADSIDEVVETEETVEEIGTVEAEPEAVETVEETIEDEEPEIIEIEKEKEVIGSDSTNLEEETDVDEPSVSLERSSEVESLLHGEEEVAPVFQTFNFMTFSSTTRTHSDGLYTVRSGDTFGAIATSFSLSQAQLREWNGHVSNINSLAVGTQLAVTRRGVERLLSPADQERLYKGGATPVFTTRQGFIDEIAPRAIAIANQEGQEGLWPSLMIAQAAHESAYGMSSLSAPPYHNLSGIKGTHNGNSTLMWTWEVYNGVRVNVLAGFRQYPSYDASLQDYANLMRRGLSWDRNYYSGTWRSKTNSVWDVLNNQGLRGYATDPAYYTKIRETINAYNLTQYDNVYSAEPKVEQNITNSFSVSYEGVLGSGYTIDTHPWGTTGFQRLGSTASYHGRTVEVVKEAQGGSYILVKLGNELLGWVDSRALTRANAERIANGISANYFTTINGNNLPVLNRPSGTSGSVKIGEANSYAGIEIKVVQESSDRRFVLLERNNQLIGWVQSTSVRSPEVQISSSTSHSYKAKVVRSGYSIDTLPWGRTGFQRISRTNNFVGQEATVIRETNNGNYVLLNINGRITGWTDKRAIERITNVKPVSSSVRVDYSAKIINSGFSIDSLPWGMNGFQRINTSTNFRGVTVSITHQHGSYVLATINGSPLGWIDRKALDNVPRVQTNVSGSNVNYSAVINGGFSIDTLPWGVNGFQRISRTSLYANQTVRAIKHSGGYALIEMNGNSLGWVDRRALQR